MLPTLSDKLGSNLQLLVPVAIAPSVMSVRRNALLELKKVDAVQVRCAGEGKKDWFVVEVFADSASTIEENVPDDARLRRPTVRVERTLVEFVELRNKVHSVAQNAHYGEACEFCTGFLDQVVFGTNPDGLLVTLIGGKRLARTMDKFMKEMLELTVQNTNINTRSCCSGQTRVPQIVHEFLFTTASDGA